MNHAHSSNNLILDLTIYSHHFQEGRGLHYISLCVCFTIIEPSIDLRGVITTLPADVAEVDPWISL